MEESNKKLKKILILFILLVSILLLFGLWFSARNIVDGSYRVGDALRDVVIASDTDEGNAIKISSEISYEVATDVDVSLVESIIKSDLNGKFENMTGVSNYAINGGDIPDDILELRIGDYYKEGYSGIMFVSSLFSGYSVSSMQRFFAGMPVPGLNQLSILFINISVALAALGIVDPQPVPKAIRSDSIHFQLMAVLISLGNLTIGRVPAVQAVRCYHYPYRNDIIDTECAVSHAIISACDLSQYLIT